MIIITVTSCKIAKKYNYLKIWMKAYNDLRLAIKIV